MSTNDSQLTELLDSVQALLQAHGDLKEQHRLLKEKLEATTAELVSLRKEHDVKNNLSTPSAESPALNAADLDALVEEIDNCIALLTR